jgi:hypothetical protein
MALPTPECTSSSDERGVVGNHTDFTNQKRTFRLKPLSFDLDSEFDAVFDDIEEKISVHNSGNTLPYGNSTAKSDARPSIDSKKLQSSSTVLCSDSSKRTLLGQISIDTVGVLFYKTAASQPRTEGDPVYLVRYVIEIIFADLMSTPP